MVSAYINISSNVDKSETFELNFLKVAFLQCLDQNSVYMLDQIRNVQFKFE